MQTRFIGVELGRIIAALLVMVFHLAYSNWATPDAPFSSSGYTFPELQPYTWFGWVGVHIFFVISGLIISSSIDASSSAGSFVWRRFVRLFPGSLICATITLAMVLALSPASAGLAGNYLRAALLSPFGPWIDGVYWSLGVEFSFYALMAAVIATGQQYRLQVVVTCLGIASSTYLMLGGSAVVGPISSMPERMVQLALLAHGVYFAIGCVLWIGITRGWTPVRLLLAFAFSYVAVSSLPPIGMMPRAALLGTILLTLALFRYQTTFDTHFPKAVRVIGFLGQATYPLYLLHCAIGNVMLMKLYELGFARYVALPLTIATVIAGSLIVTAGPKRSLRNSMRRIAGYPRHAFTGLPR